MAALEAPGELTGNRAGAGSGQGLASHERTHELSIMKVLDSVTHGRTLALVANLHNRRFPADFPDASNAGSRFIDPLG